MGVFCVGSSERVRLPLLLRLIYPLLTLSVTLALSKVWAIGLKKAVEHSGTKIGDTVVFWKDSEVRTSKAQVLERKGNMTGYSDLETDKRRGLWIMEVVS
ncbi:hypothetical protein AB7Y49_05375 [Providencia vermicola]|uniref:Uncharacterized protein n=1 Tax=Providencia vermicola TaxID=333965 RepID=A0AAX3RY00_9GAMM|nr:MULTISPECIES: hypothetical protein [Providencia]ELX8378052.1 hypothetical protein [Providencia stuartii]EMD5259508.1 hypothetical protein [Providencia stuartii]USB36032.1 hypothetical protein M5J11_14595 [Providencia vermicola]WFC05136.1 hypothetical protein PG365_10300 [Providencia vermicola]